MTKLDGYTYCVVCENRWPAKHVAVTICRRCAAKSRADREKESP